MSKLIPLTQGKCAIVDDGDYEWLCQYKWYAMRCGNVYYAGRNAKGKNKKPIYMHREILNVPQGVETDHVNGDGLDNRERNMRICTKQENQFNMKSYKAGSSKYKGVCWHKRIEKWHAQIRHNGKRIYLGVFDKENDAANAYNVKATELFGEFARLNNIKEKEHEHGQLCL